MQVSDLGLKTYSSSQEVEAQNEFLHLFKNCPVPENEIMQNIGLFINSKLMSRMLFFHHLYSLQLNTHGVVMEFGTRWGQNISFFAAMRGIYEPFNRQRKIIGFDTFEGFPSVSEKDGSDVAAKKSGYKVTSDYDKYLSRIISCQEQLNPVGHVKKYEIIKGDATKTLSDYLAKHPETMVSLAYFDMDLYEPTKKCLEMLKPHLNKGAVIGFDELCDEGFPGETLALREVFGQSVKVQRIPITSRTSYIILE